VSHSPFSTDRVKAGLSSVNSILGSDRDMLDETAFQRVIALERRRTERSRKPFMLMLVDGYEQSLLKGFD